MKDISVSIHGNDNYYKNAFSFEACMANFFLLYQIMLQMQNDELVKKEEGKCMASNQPDEINKGNCLINQQRGEINHLAPYKLTQCLPRSIEFVVMPFYDNTREHKSSESSFHFFRTVVIRGSCTDLTGAKENNEYQRTAEIFIALESSDRL